MDTLIRMKVDDINQSLIDFLQQSFKGRKIEFHIMEEDAEIDETDFVLRDPAVRQDIFTSIEDVKNNIGLKQYNSVEEIKQSFLNEPKP